MFRCFCGARLFFGNDRCLTCGRTLGFDARACELVAVEATDDGLTSPQTGLRYRACVNATLSGCPWLVRAGDPHDACRACRLNRVIPNLEDPANATAWRRVEAAKRRFVYGILRLGLPLVAKSEDASGGLAIDVKARTVAEPRVTTGHASGVVTIDLEEADPVRRESLKQELEEPYRTVLGHLRHESGHYYWMVLVDGGEELARVRELFGDDRADYAAALDRHYRSGPPPDWSVRFISRYASSHPWEDWAESWAHYLHLLDALETAYELGVREGGDRDPFREPDFDVLLADWIELTVVLNSLNRSLGLPDPYPFQLQPRVAEKLRLVHRICRRS